MAFMVAQVAGLNAPLPADFRDQLGRLTTPVERPDVFNREEGAFLEAHRP